MNELETQLKRGPGRPRNPDPLDEIKEVIEQAAMRLELGAQLRAGAMDSESRHLEVAKQTKEIMLAVAAELRALA